MILLHDRNEQPLSSFILLYFSYSNFNGNDKYIQAAQLKPPILAIKIRRQSSCLCIYPVNFVGVNVGLSLVTSVLVYRTRIKVFSILECTKYMVGIGNFQDESLGSVHERQDNAHCKLQLSFLARRWIKYTAP